MLQGRMDTGCACAGREKRAQRPCVERERSSDDLSYRYAVMPYVRMIIERSCYMFASAVYCMVLCVFCVSQAVRALDTLLAVMVGHFRAQKSRSSEHKLFFRFLDVHHLASRRATRRDKRGTGQVASRPPPTSNHYIVISVHSTVF